MLGLDRKALIALTLYTTTMLSITAYAKTTRLTPEGDIFIRCILGECRNTDYSELDSGFQSSVYGTDLGITISMSGESWILFGDTWCPDVAVDDLPWSWCNEYYPISNPDVYLRITDSDIVSLNSYRSFITSETLEGAGSVESYILNEINSGFNEFD